MRTFGGVLVLLLLSAITSVPALAAEPVFDPRPADFVTDQWGQRFAHFAVKDLAAGLPARYAGSVVIRGDDASRDDVFHRWVEVYLPNYGWVCVDPSGGDSEVPEAQATYFGGLDSRFLITTLGGGNSTYLGWGYNSNATWTGEGKVKLMQRKAGEWFPVGKKYEAKAAGEVGSLPAP